MLPASWPFFGGTATALGVAGIGPATPGIAVGSKSGPVLDLGRFGIEWRSGRDWAET